MAILESDQYQVIWLVRRLFRGLAEASSEQLSSLGINAADRAVLEFLYPEQALSVPEIAARYQVSRQHVQVTVNNLLQLNLVASEQNPRHKRSSLITLTQYGRELFDEIAQRDIATLTQLFAEVPARNIATTRRTLQALFDQLAPRGEHD